MKKIIIMLIVVATMIYMGITTLKTGIERIESRNVQFEQINDLF